MMAFTNTVTLSLVRIYMNKKSLIVFRFQGSLPLVEEFQKSDSSYQFSHKHPHREWQRKLLDHELPQSAVAQVWKWQLSRTPASLEIFQVQIGINLLGQLLPQRRETVVVLLWSGKGRILSEQRHKHQDPPHTELHHRYCCPLEIPFSDSPITFCLEVLLFYLVRLDWCRPFILC